MQLNLTQVLQYSTAPRCTLRLAFIQSEVIEKQIPKCAQGSCADSEVKVLLVQ